MMTLPSPLGALALACGLSLAGCAATDSSADQAEARALAARAAGLSTPARSASRSLDPPRWTEGAPLSSDLAAELALAANPQLRLELEAIASARIDRAEAGLLPNPVLAAGVGAITEGIAASPLSVRLLMPLVWLWQRPDRVAAADADLRGTILRAADRAARIITSTRVAHARALALERRAADTAALAAVRAREQALLEQVFEAGLVSRSELVRSTLASEDARNELAEARAAAAAARRTLLEWVGRAEGPAGFSLLASVEAAGGALPHEARATEEELVRIALEQRLDVAAARAEVHSADARRDLADFARWPALGLGVGLERNFSGSRALTVGGEVTPPLFDGGAVVVARAETDQRAAVLRALVVSQRAVREVRAGLADLEGAREIHERWTGAILPEAERDLRLARAEVASGTRGERPALAAEARALRRRIEVHARTFERVQARLALELAIGGPLPRSAP